MRTVETIRLSMVITVSSALVFIRSSNALFTGCLIDNFTCDGIYNQAVEVTAGNRLFYHIVSTDRVGMQLLNEINKQHLLGEVNFLPLNRILDRERRYPDNPVKQIIYL